MNNTTPVAALAALTILILTYGVTVMNDARVLCNAQTTLKPIAVLAGGVR